MTAKDEPFALGRRRLYQVPRKLLDLALSKVHRMMLYISMYVEAKPEWLNLSLTRV
jgi:hypothetical protein